VPEWVIWTIVALALAVGEIFTPGLFILGPVALAAVIAGILSLLGVGAIAQVIVFIACSIASVALIRPIAKNHLRMPAAIRTGTAALTGTKALGAAAGMLTTRLSSVITGCGWNETTCSRRSISGRSRSMNGITMATPGLSVRW
jgi:hypothetical protein